MSWRQLKWQLQLKRCRVNAVDSKVRSLTTGVQTLQRRCLSGTTARHAQSGQA